MDYTIFPISEMRPRKCTDSMEFHSWKVNIKTEACSKTADPNLTMHWIKEVEIAKSIRRTCDIAIDHGANRFSLTTICLIRWLRLHWKKYFSTCMFTSAKEQASKSSVAQRYDRFLRVKTNCLHDLRAFSCNQSLWSSAKRLSDLFKKRLQSDDVQDFDVRWDQALLAASEIPTEMILEGLYKSKLQDSVQLQTVLALYDQETVRNNVTIEYIQDWRLL